MEIRTVAKEVIQNIQKIDFSKLDISDYNKQYIKNLLPHIDYYFEIYSYVVKLLKINIVPSDYIVDFGGGHGFMSLFLKKLGYNVIYCDHNPLSVKTITILKDLIGYGPDIILEGSSSKLLYYCKKNNLHPKYLIATDLIEHVYDLNCLFSDFQALNPNLEMAFTTGSVKSNILKTRKLRKIMIEEDVNVYFSIRKQFLIEKYPSLSSSEIVKLAKLTRGLIFPDIIKQVDTYLKTNILPVINIDKYNTCDPKTGNWTERILSKKQYRKILNYNDFQVTFKNGFYNKNRSNPVFSTVAVIMNFFIKYFRFSASIINPFMVLIVKK